MGLSKDSPIFFIKRLDFVKFILYNIELLTRRVVRAGRRRTIGNRDTLQIKNRVYCFIYFVVIMILKPQYVVDMS